MKVDIIFFIEPPSATIRHNLTNNLLCYVSCEHFFYQKMWILQHSDFNFIISVWGDLEILEILLAGVSYKRGVGDGGRGSESYIPLKGSW